MARLEWRPIPDFVAEKTGQDYTIRNIKQYLINPIGVGVTAEGFGGVSATISGNNLIITEFGTPTDNPYIVLTASRPVSPAAYLPADTEIARTFINVRLIPKATTPEDGEDGVGTEIVYAVTDQNSIPSTQYPDNNWGYNNGGTIGGLTWHTDPQSVSSATPNQFIAERQVIGTPDDGNNVTDTWSTPALWSRYAEDGEDGKDGTDGAGEAGLWDYGTWTRTRGNADVVDFSGATEVSGGASETRDISPPLLPSNHSMENVRGTLTGKRESPRQIAVGYVTKNDNMLRLGILKHRTDQAGSIQNMHIYFQGQYQLLQTSQGQSQSASRKSSAFDKKNNIF